MGGRWCDGPGAFISFFFLCVIHARSAPILRKSACLRSAHPCLMCLTVKTMRKSNEILNNTVLFAEIFFVMVSGDMSFRLTADSFLSILVELLQNVRSYVTRIQIWSYKIVNFADIRLGLTENCALSV